MSWFVVFMVVIGDLLIIGRNRNGFLLWVVCDGFFCYVSLLKGSYPEAVVFGIYAVLGAVGFSKWKQIK